MWKLAAGGLIAVIVLEFKPWERARSWLAGIGLLLILLAMGSFSDATAFPGYAALLPVVGAGPVIFANASTQSATGALFRPAPVQFLGDVSYPLYLWHWPLIVFAPFVLAEVTFLARMAIMVLAIGWAAATKYVVEDPVRFSPVFTRSGLATTALLLGCSGLGAISGTILHRDVTSEIADAPDRLAAAKESDPDCFGAGSIRNSCDDSQRELAMAPIYALGDRAVLDRDNCWNEQPYQTRKVCHYGPEDAEVCIALVGNSHAGHWFGPLEDLAAENAWSITTYVS